MAFRLNRLIVVACGLAVVGGATSAAALLATQPGPTHEDKLVTELQTQVAQASDPAIRTSLEEKLRIAQEAQQEEAAAAQQAVDPAQAKKKLDDLATEGAVLATTPTVTLPHNPAGAGFLVDGAMPQLSASEFLARNDWFFETGPGEREVAWAGVSGQNQAQGEVVIIDESDAKGFHVVGFYPTPAAHGAIRISGATGKVLTLKADDGTELTFDVPSRSYK